MYCLIYRSEAAETFGEKELKNLLVQSREKNADLGITGMLINSNEKFIQLLEGTEKNVKELYKTICHDSRHKNVTTLKEGEIDNRLFPEWTMSFRTIPADELASEPAYKNIYTPNTSGSADLVALFKYLRTKPEAFP